MAACLNHLIGTTLKSTNNLCNINKKLLQIFIRKKNDVHRPIKDILNLHNYVIVMLTRNENPNFPDSTSCQNDPLIENDIYLPISSSVEKF